MFNNNAISDFRRGVNKIFALLRCYAALIELGIDVSGDLSASSSRMDRYSRILDCIAIEDGADRLSLNVGD